MVIHKLGVLHTTYNAWCMAIGNVKLELNIEPLRNKHSREWTTTATLIMFSVHWSISCMCKIYWWHVYQMPTKTKQNNEKQSYINYTFCGDGDIRLGKARNYEHWTLISRHPCAFICIVYVWRWTFCVLVTYSCHVRCGVRDKVRPCHIWWVYFKK